MITVLRWGQAEYERGLVDLGPEVRVVEAPGTDAAPLEEADVVAVPSLRPVRAEHLPRLRRCRLVLTTTSGFDHVDVPALTGAGIPVARLPLARRDAVVHTALGMILALTRRFGLLAEGAAAGRWDRDRLPAVGASLLGPVGVVGVGVIGRRMVEVLDALGAEVLPCDPALPGALPLEAVLERAEVVTLHCALTPETRGRFDAATLARMRPGAVLVNTARGRVVDADAALAAVHAGHLAGLGLDVFPSEPQDLRRFVHPRVIVHPHAAGWHPGLGAAIAAGITAAVRALLAGEPVPYAIVPAPP